jgi:hypothetical protein
MKPSIDSARFGSITIVGKTYKHDVVIRLDGRVEKRKKQLSKQIYGSSHTVSSDEIGEVYEEGATLLVVGTGAFGSVRLSDEADAYLADRDCRVIMVPTQKLRRLWNELADPAIGLIHITC